MSPFKVIIVGGGLAGSLLANGLVNNNVDVKVYERDSENTEREGYQIRLGHYSLSGFRDCLDPEHIALIEEKYGLASGSNGDSPYTAPSVYSPKFKRIIDLGKLPGYTVSTTINRVVLRNFLLGPLREKSKVVFNTSFSHFEIIQSTQSIEKVRVHFADGTSDTCDVLIGADGSSSKINRQLGLKNIVDITSHFVFNAKGDLPPERIRKLPERLRDGPILVFHKGAILFYGLYLPKKKGTDGKVNELFNYDYAEASFYWSFLIPKKDSVCENESQIPDRLQFCLDYVKDWAPEFHVISRNGRWWSPRSVHDFGAGEYEALLQWRDDLQGRMTEKSMSFVIAVEQGVLTVVRGMGGNQAMYDCVDMLPELLKLNSLYHSQHSISTEQIRAAVTRYEDKMLDRAFQWVQKSGGIIPPEIDLNGLLGYIISLINLLVLPIVFAISSLF
ncbi:hypothetical protein CLAIMM_04667 [Cladophialophora immunda]|nr:hypothetical protein CLAIMM_04667 [Cladophialophora immunda]